MKTFQYKKLNPNAKPPQRAEDSIGYDLYASEDVIVPPWSSQVIPTGVALAFPMPYGAFIWDRSSYGAKGVRAVGFDVATKFAGCIEGTYRGEWKVVLLNCSYKPLEIKVGNKVAQVVFQEVQLPVGEEVDELPESVRGTGGFGSTGES